MVESLKFSRTTRYESSSTLEDGEIKVDKPVNKICVAFRVGDSVTILIGVLAGRTGLVEVIDQNTLIVRELNTLREVRCNIQIPLKNITKITKNES